jgi:colanic acid/amylovoran biosynthesis protein
VPVHLAADVAFGLVPTARNKASAYLSRMLGIDADNTRMMALSVSEGVIRYSGLDRAKYFTEMAEFVRRMTTRGFHVLLIPHVQERNPNNDDIIACEELHSHLQDASMCKIVSGELTASDFKGIIGMTECLVGARTHATIASMSQGVPTVSIAYSRKAYGIMNDVFGAKLGAKLTIAASDLAADRLEHCFDQALAAGNFAAVAARMKELAETNYVHLANALGNFQEGAMKWTPG